MKTKIKYIILLIVSQFIINAHAQKMDNDRLEIILNVVSDSIVGQKGAWQFKIEERIFMCVTDENHNRMRIMSPIMSQDELSDKDLIKSLEANFHTALDVKYAISSKVLWSIFIHPLKELSDSQVKDAISQVYFAALTYGTTYTSTNLTFPGSTVNGELIEEEDEPLIKERRIDKKLLKKN
jgi:hypothetical protein